jgi:hypothetical protein
MKQVSLFLLLTVWINTIQAQHSKPDTLTALYCDQPIKLDGKLDEACWSKAVPIDNFTQREQNEGAPATEKTKIAVVYNTNQLYFGIWCYDSEPNKISAHQMTRDFSWRSDDNIEIMLSPFNDNRSGYLFVTNPNGAMADVLIGNEGQDWNKDWNGVWDARVTRNQEGWFVEIVIPFSTLKFKSESVQTWGINFERNIRRKKEQIMWQAWSRQYEVESISQAGKLIGLDNIKQGTKIELNPFILAGLEFENGETDNSKKIGGEVNFDITPTLKLNFTLNTDFAQVESDRKQINLSRFSLFYPEKRQFFLEGKNYYDMNLGHIRLFHSRSIGIDQETEIPVLGGLRFFGKLDRTNIGVMSIQTDSKDTIPTTNYSIIKVNQDIFKRSSIGLIATQKYSKDHYNRVYGTNFNYATSKLFTDKNLLIGGGLAISETETFDQEEPAKSLNDKLAYNIFLSYPNDVIEYDLSFTSVATDFNPEMGYARRTNYQMFYTELQFNPRFKKLPFFRNLIFKPVDIKYFINEQTKETESIFYEWRPLGFVTKSGEFFEFNIQHLYDNPTEDFELFDDIFIPAGSYWDNRIEFQTSSFKGRKVSADAAISFGDFYTGRRQQYEVSTSFNFNKHLNIRIDWQHNDISLPQKAFTTNELGGRIDYAFNPKLQTGMFAQWNNEDQDILVNYRINWIPKVGSYFYFVINQELDTSNHLELKRTTILGKLIWRFTI